MNRFELEALAMTAKNDNSKFRLLLENSGSIIGFVVSGFTKGGNEQYKDEYYSEAIYALYRCLEKYDSKSGAFASYASNAIKIQIRDFIRNRQSLVKLGTTKLDEIRKVDVALKEIQELGLETSIDNIKKYSGITSDKTLSTVLWAKKMKTFEYLDTPCKENNETNIIDLVSDDYIVDDDVLLTEEQDCLKKNIFSLDPKDSYLIVSMFGLFGHEELSNEEIAKRLNISVQTVSYRKKLILNKLRSMMEAWAS